MSEKRNLVVCLLLFVAVTSVWLATSDADAIDLLKPRPPSPAEPPVVSANKWAANSISGKIFQPTKTNLRERTRPRSRSSGGELVHWTGCRIAQPEQILSEPCG